MRQWVSRVPGPGRRSPLVLVCLLVLALSGCLKLDAALTVNADDTITGDYVVAYKKDPHRPEAGLGAARELLVTSGTATASRYDDGQYEGTRYRLEQVPLADLARFVPVTYETRQTGGIQIIRDASDFVVAGAFDFRETKPTPRTDEQQRQAEDLFTVRVRITFPGPVQSGNGTVEGNTVSWTMKPFVLTTLQARASAVPAPPAAAQSSLGTVVLTAGIGVGAVALLVALLLALRSRRRRRLGPAPPRPEPTADPTDFSWVLGDRQAARQPGAPPEHAWATGHDPRFGPGLGGSGPAGSGPGLDRSGWDRPDPPPPDPRDRPAVGPPEWVPDPRRGTGVPGPARQPAAGSGWAPDPGGSGGPGGLAAVPDGRSGPEPAGSGGVPGPSMMSSRGAVPGQAATDPAPGSGSEWGPGPAGAVPGATNGSGAGAPFRPVPPGAPRPVAAEDADDDWPTSATVETPPAEPSARQRSRDDEG